MSKKWEHRLRLRGVMQEFLRPKGFGVENMSYNQLKDATKAQLGLPPEQRITGGQLRKRIGKERPKLRKSFYERDDWRALRYQVLKLYGGACQCCGARPSVGKPLHVDHIKPRSKYPELELELSNLQVLCADCNLGKRAWDETDWRNVVPFPKAMA